MIDEILRKELDKIIDEQKQYFQLEELKNNFCFDKYFFKDKFEIELSHEYLNEFSLFLNKGYEIVIPSLIDLNTIFIELEKGTILSPYELENVLQLLSSSEFLYDSLFDKKEFYHLNDDALDLNPLIYLKKELEKDIEKDYTISSNASNKLKEIRNKIFSIKKQLTNIINTYKNKYSEYLSNDLIALKGGEECLPIKVSYKNLVKGSIIAYSSTGETVFMIPYEVINLRNDLSSLLEEESAEISKILADLSSKCLKEMKILKRDYEIIFTFDKYLAFVKYGNAKQFTIASISDNEFILKGLFHPLLDSKKVVTNSLSLGNNDPKALLISGPNAGGKSILIKSIALTYLLNSLGMMVNCKSEAIIPLFDEIYFMSGDNQSVLDNLSTFSSHILNIKNIVENASCNSLVIIDEIGEGTSPKDGEALGVGILKYFLRLNCFTILTSHYDGMKMFAASSKLVLSSAMEFDSSSLKPTYHLLLNTTGKSYGIVLAKDIGLKDEIINDAISYQDEKSNKNVDALMEKLTEQVSNNENKERILDEKIKYYQELAIKRENAISALNEEKKSIKEKAEKKINKIVDEKIKSIDQIWQNNNDKISYSQISKAKGELNKLKEEKKVSEIKPLPVLHVGDLVMDEEKQVATVIEIKKDTVLLNMGGLKIKRNIQGLKKTTQIKKENKNIQQEFVDLNIFSSQGIELNIIGLHVDEAMRKVVSFLDSARLKKYTSVRIIHGAGTFALKNAVWKYLANHKEFVKDYRLGGENEGGFGATIVYIK